MNILHLFSNCKWTDPAEPAVNLASEVKKLGHRVFFAAGRPTASGPRCVHEYAEERGMEVIHGMRLAKHVRLVANLADARVLRRIIDDNEIDIVHTHLPNDHLIAALAARRMPSAPKIVRTFYEGSCLPWGIRTIYLLSKHTDRAIFCSKGARDATIARYLFDERKTVVLAGAIDLRRFDPGRELPDGRSRLGLEPADYVVGIVARGQRHRRFHVLVDAAKKVAGLRPDFRLLILGRGEDLEAAAQPVSAPGLQNVVKFAGCLSGDDYVGCLASLDAKVFLVPGSDGSRRAVREAMAMGLPVIAANRGMLPEIVEDGVTGRVIDDTADSLAAAIVELGDRSKRRSLGAAAAKRVRRDFDVRRLARNVVAVYEELFNAD
ncbi:MAG: glycosyltransferase family 4 protein [Planctomycetes bacterium]|nr:glycosyltransferase family 4 protein [Planctomycetota bacterium]